jgi:hypothetical protein
MDYLLRYKLSADDIDFLNVTSIAFEIIDTHGLRPETDITDSGWCDASTGARIIGENDRAVFKDVQDEDLPFLTLKFGDRLRLMHLGLAAIYKYNSQDGQDKGN